MTAVILGLVIAFVAAVVVARAGYCEPLTLEELSRTSRAGVDNSIPAEFRTRAIGLGVVLGRVKCLNFCRITSMWRSNTLNAIIRAENAARGTNQEFAPSNPNAVGAHNTATGSDLAPGTPLNPIRVNRSRGTAEERAYATQMLTEIRDRLLASDVGPFVKKALIEDDHVHVQWDAAVLEEIGQRFTIAQGAA